MTKDTHTDNEELEGILSYFAAIQMMDPVTRKVFKDCLTDWHQSEMDRVSTKSSGELEAILHNFGKQYEWPYSLMRDKDRSPADQQEEAQAELTAQTVAAIHALHTTQTTKLQAEARIDELKHSKLAIWHLDSIRYIDKRIKHLEREHKIGEADVVQP